MMRTLLLIEDNDADVYLLEDALSEAGVSAQILSLVDGVQAKDYIAGMQVPPDLVLLDLNMPKMDGISLLRHIRQEGALAGVPIVVWSSTQYGRDFTAVQELGVTQFLVKPATLEEWSALGVKLRQILEQPVLRA